MTSALPASDPSDPARHGRRFTLVQALRGIAALWVVLFHAQAGGHVDHLVAVLPPAASALIFTWGETGVPIFFALSGFVIAHSLRDVRLTWGFLGRFAVRRSIRLDPAYWASILLAIAVGIAAAFLRHRPMPLVTPGRILAHLAYLQEFLGVSEINSVYWTLTYEVQFYLFFAAMLTAGATLTTASGRRVQPLIWAILLALALASASGLFDRGPRGLFLPLWSDFFVGALGYVAGREPGWRPVFAVLIAAMLARAVHDHAPFTVASGLTAGLLTWGLAQGFVEHALSRRWLQGLGAISYSLYLTHNPVTAAIGFATTRSLPADARGDLAGLVLMVAASLLVASAFWWLIERPSHRLSRRIPWSGAA